MSYFLEFYARTLRISAFSTFVHLCCTTWHTSALLPKRFEYVLRSRSTRRGLKNRKLTVVCLDRLGLSLFCVVEFSALDRSRQICFLLFFYAKAHGARPSSSLAQPVRMVVFVGDNPQPKTRSSEERFLAGNSPTDYFCCCLV